MADEPHTFHPREKVLSTAVLPGVPAGTRGVVVAVAGLTWVRYRVRFDNGVELGSLDPKYLTPRTS
jgi:hypothetical protein